MHNILTARARNEHYRQFEVRHTKRRTNIRFQFSTSLAREQIELPPPP